MMSVFPAQDGALLHQSAILIVEDEPIIAMALAFEVRAAGGLVIGPAASVKAALHLLETHTVVAAILDVTVTDGTIIPVVDYLMARKVPLILHTGVGIPDTLASRYPDLHVRIKPTSAANLVADLAELIA